MNEKNENKQIYRVIINAPIERVWSEIVNTTSPRPFFYDALCDTPGLEPGAPYRMVSKDRKFAFVVGEVVAFEPPYLYTQTFKFTTNDDPPCTVTYALREVDGGVEFSLITENAPVGTKTEKSMAEGSKWISENLKAYIETGKVSFGAQLMLGVMGLIAPLTPKSASIEKWPLGKYEQS